MFLFSFELKSRLLPSVGSRLDDTHYFFISLMITWMSAVEILPSPLRS